MMDSELAVIWVYRKLFSNRNAHLKDDLMQEAKLNILREYRRMLVSDDVFRGYIPKLAIQGMITFIRKTYHMGSKLGFLEVPASERDIRGSLDYSIQERLLFMDIHKVSELEGYRGSTFKDTGRITAIITLLYQGYGFQEISELMNSDRGNIWRSSRRFGRRLLSAWRS